MLFGGISVLQWTYLSSSFSTEAVRLLANWHESVSKIIGTNTSKERQDAEMELLTPRHSSDFKVLNQSKLLIALWVCDFKRRPDTLFILDFAASLAELGHKVRLESPVDGEVLRELHPQYDFGAKINVNLQNLISGKSSAWMDAADEDLPQLIIFFSSLWSQFFIRMPHGHPDVHLVWYYYEPHQCPRPKDLSGAVTQNLLASREFSSAQV